MTFPFVTISAAAFASVAAIDYPGGWLPGKEQCVDICKNSKATPGCFNASDTACTSKKQRPGDYDYLVFDQIFAPQFCRDLLKGKDSTVTHQNVNPYPVGIQCDVRRTPSALYVHGLWPNYNNGYPGCCNVSDVVSNKPFNASTFQTKYPHLFAEMDKLWVDPAVNSSAEGLSTASATARTKTIGTAKDYFESTLDVTQRLTTQSNQIATWAAETATTTLDQITGLYSKKVAVLCSKFDTEKKNRLLAVRTCWTKAVNFQVEGSLPGDQMDCSPTTGSAACDPTKPITLDAYEAPPRPSVS
ncbi:hypothetical protein H310_11646 [Aphanomyces invadans]|uniref:Uncharacterized protein n=1 Tax=Aphanomyces invadans TaxID=157072 RepID=A0A024TKT6_9STRA|nr:hypothetical protein H310_11646 [Aphanomyces invadans]ETV94658.1 hypothetical protein H310_11646 [Aphanomyces invadans]|eukprot:XP_008876603.1 hypothetical protein H310_11646 [Aphanomyces invadans]